MHQRPSLAGSLQASIDPWPSAGAAGWLVMPSCAGFLGCLGCTRGTYQVDGPSHCSSNIHSLVVPAGRDATSPLHVWFMLQSK